MDNKPKLFVYILRTGQYIVPYTLAAISILAKFILGEGFYLLHPDALWLCVPVVFLLIYVKLRLDNQRDKIIESAYWHASSNGKQNTTHLRFLNAEKYIYYVVYFLSDIVTSFELFSIIGLACLNINVFYLYAWLFPTSIIYALFVHLAWRSEDFAERYNKLSYIVETQEFYIPHSLTTTAATVFLFFVAIYAQHMPILALFCTLSALYLSITYHEQHIHSLYSLYLFISSLSQLQNFSRLLLHESSLLSFLLPYPKIIPYTQIAYTSLALLYACVYYSSTIRNDHLAHLYNDSHSSKAYS